MAGPTDQTHHSGVGTDITELREERKKGAIFRP